MVILAVVGADSLLARHLTSLLFSPLSPLPHPPSEIRLWSREETSHPLSLDSQSSSSLIFFHGDHRLEETVEGAEVVINCHECVDWSLLPDESKLQRENVDVPLRILSVISPSARLIHISSTFVQSWGRWPNIAGKEQQAGDYATGWPFQAYCASRVEGEKAVLDREGATLVVRVPPLYGEGDEKSPLTDIIKASSLFSSTIPFIGDGDGCTQFSYAGNVAMGIVRGMNECLEKKEDDHLRRVVIIGDDTPINNTYTTVLPMVQNGKLGVSSFSIPFYLFFLSYFLFASLLRLLSRVVEISSTIRKFPDPWVFYFFFRHWTFFSSFKARFFLNHTDPFTKEESLARSAAYYRKLDPAKILQYSWEGR
ncbi:hypothetical protein PMAYCL1PPCAC_29049 [Pristionchus mayeri]|uniref:NAD-dependent epimerase/dehydratase domain-containing protein n=1 Tax=Pristionchus mayeri TaxID=1317129 RepID=A0AAN5DBF9_9BILA|nr:hypothetical protein PMAYCL1PPCAC_29049 [Pristionchus mayeri]